MTDTRTNALGQPIGAPVAGTFPRPRPPHSPMVGHFASVVPLDPDAHAAALFDADRLDAEGASWTYLPYGPFESLDAYRRWMDAACLGPDPLFHTVLDADGAPVGLASYLRIDPQAGSIEVGHLHFSPRLQRTPAATEAMALMMARAFDTLGYRRYEWKCDALNAPSCRAARRLGFTYEGTHRQATHYKGRNRDTAWFSILDGEWPRVRDAFAAWLAPENFAQDGRQRRPLAAAP